MRWIAGGMLGLALVLWMWTPAPAREAEEEIRELRRDIKALSVLQKLELTDKQRSQLASIYKQFKALRDEHNKKLLDLLKRKKELLLSGRASREELIDLDGKLKGEEVRFRTEVEKLKAKAEEVLTPEQRGKLGRAWFAPKRPGRPHERFGPPPPGPFPEEMKERRMRLFWRMMELLGEGK